VGSVAVQQHSVRRQFQQPPKRHRRSLNNEAILSLEAGLRAAPPSEDRLEEIRALRQGLPVGTFDPAVIEGFKGEGRP